MADPKNLGLVTNQVAAMQKAKRAKVSQKSLDAIATGDVQSVIDTLTDKQINFCQEYLLDLDATKAVRRAGYTTKYPNRVAYQLMENPAIRLCIDSLKIERGVYTDVTKDFVLEKIVKTLERAEADGNHNATLRAAELLAKHLGMFIERKEISGPDGEAIKYEKVEEDVADFTRTIAGLVKRTGEG